MKWFEILNEYWGMALFIGGLIFHAIWTYFQVGNHAKRISDIETKTDKVTATISSVETKIASIDAKLDILLSGYHKEK